MLEDGNTESYSDTSFLISRLAASPLKYIKPIKSVAHLTAKTFIYKSGLKNVFLIQNISEKIYFISLSSNISVGLFIIIFYVDATFRFADRVMNKIFCRQDHRLRLTNAVVIFSFVVSQ